MVELFANNGDPDSAVSDLGLHCLPVTLLRVARLQWVKATSKICSRRHSRIFVIFIFQIQ